MGRRCAALPGVALTTPILRSEGDSVRRQRRRRFSMRWIGEYVQHSSRGGRETALDLERRNDLCAPLRIVQEENRVRGQSAALPALARWAGCTRKKMEVALHAATQKREANIDAAALASLQEDRRISRTGTARRDEKPKRRQYGRLIGVGSDYSRVDQDEELSPPKVAVKLSRVKEDQSQRRRSRSKRVRARTRRGTRKGVQDGTRVRESGSTRHRDGAMG
jgi:hypothetical protein